MSSVGRQATGDQTLDAGQVGQDSTSASGAHTEFPRERCPAEMPDISDRPGFLHARRQAKAA